MKILLSALILFFSLCPTVARAESDTPHIVIEGETWLYDEKGEKIFLLPITYYARINNLDEVYYYVTFNGVHGRVKKNEVRAVGYNYSVPSSAQDLTLKEEYADFSGIELKKYPDLSAETITSIPSKSTFTFLGKYPTASGEKWYYVRYENSLGYVKAERTNAPDLNIPDFVPEIESSSNTEDGDEILEEEVVKSLDSTELKIIIIVGLAVPAVAIVVLLFKRK